VRWVHVSELADIATLLRGGELVLTTGIALPSAAANALHLSRPAFYHRLATIERVPEVDLDSAESWLSLHVALVALDALRDATGAPRPR
jgi:hypothetical protein